MRIVDIKCKDKDFKVTWNFHDQRYLVYYKGKYFATGYRYLDIVAYTK